MTKRNKSRNVYSVFHQIRDWASIFLFCDQRHFWPLRQSAGGHAHPQQYFANDLSGRTGLKALHGIFSLNDEGYRHQLLALKLEHRDLDDAIAALRAVGSTDQLQIARLKKKKLGLKDQIMRLEDQLIPDIIA